MFPQPSSGTKLARRGALVTLFALIFLTASAACRRSNVESNTNTDNSSVAASETSATPPFSTKEPERYQWTSVTTVTLGDQASPAGATPANTTTSQVFVARDGELRREDYELTPGMKVSFLQLAGGRYRLLHSQKVYAELKPDESATAAAQSQNVPSDFSPDKLLNASRTEARYEKLGTEEVNGRTTTKYRITVAREIGEAKTANTENLVWVDESLGVPVKTETTSAGGSRYTMELRDIKLEVDAALFALPPDYKKVESKEIDKEMLSTYLLGGDSEEKSKETGQAKKK
jgi:hypothetical protein